MEKSTYNDVSSESKENYKKPSQWKKAEESSGKNWSKASKDKKDRKKTKTSKSTLTLPKIKYDHFKNYEK